MAPLNPNAKAFVPLASADNSANKGRRSAYLPSKPFFDQQDEENVTPQELDELEAAEEWVNMMAWLEDLEREHLIELALRNAPKWKLELIHKRVEMPKAVNRKAQARAGCW